MQKLLSATLLLVTAGIVGGAQEPGQTPCQAKQRGVHFPTPERYRAEVVQSADRHRPVLLTRRDRLYRTTIREAAAGQIDFAGHYAVAKWGCGTGCLGFAVVDVLTGRVYDPAFREVDYHYSTTDDGPVWTCFPDLVNYSATSRLLVVEGCPAGAACGRHFFVPGAHGLHEIQYDPDLPQTAAHPASQTTAP